MNRNVEEKLSQVEKKRNNFEEYGFKADFDGEIYFKESCDYMYGLVNNVAYFWNKDGFCYESDIDEVERVYKYDLTPIKKKWYEIEENFPCLVVTEDGDYKETFVAIKFNKEAYTLDYSDGGWGVEFCRPATNEEVDALKIKQ